MTRWTMEELEAVSDKALILDCIRERRAKCTNYYSPLSRRLKALIESVETTEDTDHDRRNDEAAEAWQGQVEAKHTPTRDCNGCKADCQECETPDAPATIEPWEFDAETGIIRAHGIQIASVMPTNRKANARLVAAAPDLLAALEAVFSCVVWDSETDGPKWELDADTQRVVKEAIAKATNS